MNAAKQLKKMLDAGRETPQLETLKALVICLYREQPFALARLKTLDEQHCRLALQLLQDWCLDLHADARSKLLERLFGMHPELMLPQPHASAPAASSPQPAPQPSPPRRSPAKRSPPSPRQQPRASGGS